jgi:energy-coupling factor transporter ATP-binding protein EcfA2
MNFDSINLFLGGNGAGKSTVFEVLRKIQIFISGNEKVEVIFKSHDCTRWQTLQLQRFELEISGNGGNYKYEFAIRHNPDKSHVEYERLWFNNQLLFKIEEKEFQLSQEDGKIIRSPINESQFSILSFFVGNSKLHWFKNRIERFIIVQIIPILMVDGSENEEIQLTYRMENFVYWYRYISQD